MGINCYKMICTHNVIRKNALEYNKLYDLREKYYIL